MPWIFTGNRDRFRVFSMFKRGTSASRVALLEFEASTNPEDDFAEEKVIDAEKRAIDEGYTF